MSDELKPCPFCGGEASDAGSVRYSTPLNDTWWDDHSAITEAFFVNCMSCFGSTKTTFAGGQRTREKAIAAWNTRAAEARIERLEASHAELVAALSECDGAIAEYERYWHGGETRGSYDGKPERRNLFAAKYRARTALSNAKALEVGNA